MRHIPHPSQDVCTRPGETHAHERLAEVRMVLRPPRHEPAQQATAAADMIAPIERGLTVLASFRIGDEWLGNQEIAQRTGIPKATVTRLTQTLTAEGFLHRSERLRKYRVAPAVLTLGFAIADNATIATIAGPLMQRFADDCGVFVSLAGRDGLDMVIARNCHSATNRMTLALNTGARFPMAASPLGLALLCGLPESERNYLLDRIRLRYKPEYRLTLRQRVAGAMEQIAQKGYCASSGDWGDDLVVAAAPLNIPDRPPFVIACAGSATSLSKARLVEQVGPRLVALICTLQSMQPQIHE